MTPSSESGSRAETADPAHFVGPVGNATDKYASRNPLKRKLLERFLEDVDRIVGAARPASILDVGCGEGVVTERLALTIGAQTVGVDLGDERLTLEWQRRERDGLSFRAASVYELPYDDASFDCVCALEVLEHLERPQAGLEEMARVARRALVLSVPREPLWRIVHLAALQNVRSLGNTPGHVNHWSSGAFRRLVSGFGDVVELRTPTPWTLVLVEPRPPA